MASYWLVLRTQRPPLSFRFDRRVPVALLALALVTGMAVVASVSYGEYRVPPLAVIKTILGLETGDPNHPFVVNVLRLPRALVAVLVGMGLAIAGTLIQGITRNPLAAPGIIGVNAGAALAAVTLIVALPNAPVSLLPFAAFGGALAVSVLVYLLAWQGGSSPVRFVLVGIGLNSLVSSLTGFMTAFGQIDNVSRALVWLTGSVYGRGWDHVLALVPWLVVLGVLALVMARELNTLSLGDALAAGLGSRVEWQRGVLLLTSVGLAGSAVATAGGISFVGLMAPHLARRLVGAAHESLVPTAALMGGMLVVVADLLGRVLFPGTELPCGSITSAIGAPFLIYLLVRRRPY